MASLEKKSFNAPEERRTPPNTTMETVRFGDRAVARITYQPGWRWTTDIRPTTGTDLCQLTLRTPKGRRVLATGGEGL